MACQSPHSVISRKGKKGTKKEKKKKKKKERKKREEGLKGCLLLSVNYIFVPFSVDLNKILFKTK